MKFNEGHLKGGWAEAVATAYFLQNGFMVFNNVMAAGPIDIIAVPPKLGAFLLDIKLEGKRRITHANGNRSKNSYRINRPLKPIQKWLRVHTVYVNAITGVKIVPPIKGLDGACDNRPKALRLKPKK